MGVSLHNSPVLDSGSVDSLPSIGGLREPRTGLRGGRNKSYSAAERLWARVIKQPNGCWEVQGWATHSGHVQINRKSEGLPVIRAHRLAWELLRGPIPRGKKVLHNCPTGDNPRCVNPDHLFLGTQHDNILDSIRKGRYSAWGKQKLNAAQVLEIRALSAKGVPQHVIAAKFGVRRHSVSAIVTRKSWRHV